jgi:23S rRNA (cytidine2498-2'-O)-methyltransferase
LEPGPAYPHLILESVVDLKGDGVNSLAHAVLDFLAASLVGERIDGPWPCVFGGAAAPEGLGPRVRSVEAAFGEVLGKKLGRLARLASPSLPRGVGAGRGLFVWFTDYGRAFAARSAWRNGQRRMADDPLAPSRSYLKVEEAYGILGCEPGTGETVCDLGASPGGWSYSAARRGARVIAVDNGPLKGGALGHPQIDHRCEDAFRFAPPEGSRFDWLFCDMVESPHHVLGSILEPWLARRWCRRFVVNLKLGRVDPIALLGELAAEGSPLAIHAEGVRIRHLYHDRDEVTATGRLKV